MDGRVVGTFIMRTLASLFVGLVLVPAPAAATMPGPDGRLAFTRGAFRGTIVTSEPDGSNLDVLLELKGRQWAQHLAWSPDGSRILFNGCCYGPHDSVDLWTIDADGSDLTQITHAPADETQAAWSPDGTRIVYVAREGRGTNLWTANADGSNRQWLTLRPGKETEPTWSPDGETIVYVADPRDGPAVLATISPDNTDQGTVGDVQNVRSPDWSPDGTHLLYVRKGNVWTIQPDGSGRERISDYPTTWTPAGGGRSVLHQVDEARWSPSGAHIVYGLFEATQRDFRFHFEHELWTMDADGSDQTVVLNTGPNDADRSASWGPA